MFNLILFLQEKKYSKNKRKVKAKIYKSELVENPDSYKVVKFSGRGPGLVGMKILKVFESLLISSDFYFENGSNIS